MKHVFISYSRQNADITKIIINDIEALGCKVWFDSELVGAQAWWRQILKWIRECDLFIFILSQEGIDSMACKRESGYAADLGKPILPILVSEISGNLLPPELYGIQYIDYRKQDKQAVLDLVKSLNSIQPAGKLPDPLPPDPEIPGSYLGGFLKEIESTSTMDINKQSAILTRLKPVYAVMENRGDTIKLLVKLRKREDLFAIVADQIDELLFDIIKKPKAVSEIVKVKSSIHGFDLKEHYKSATSMASIESPDNAKVVEQLDKLFEGNMMQEKSGSLDKIITGNWTILITQLFAGSISSKFHFMPDGTFSGQLLSLEGPIPVQGRWKALEHMLSLRGTQTLAFVDYPYSADIAFATIHESRLEGTSQAGETIIMDRI